MIGSAANISFNDFLINTGIPAIIIGVATLACFYFIYGRKMQVAEDRMQMVEQLDEKKAIKSKRLLILSLILMAFVVLAFIFHGELGIESSVIAVAAAIIIILISGEDAEEVIISVEWPTIVFFVGLFGVVGGMQETGVIDKIAHLMLEATAGKELVMILLILWVSAIFSSFLDNIPFVATLIPIIITMGQSGVDTEPLWWALSLGACLGGNGTLVGASANVVLAGIGKKNGHEISFARYFKVGFPMMLMSIIISTIYLVIKFA
jgi:Na+/H+ antiporter NhaD/arsenite permease-like protein